MANRRHHPRQAKTLRSYTLPEAAELYGVHRNTIRHWLASGLQPIDRGRPLLIHGAELNRFATARRAAVSGRCGPAELYCLACRAPRRPALDMADYLPLSSKVGTISAICPACGRMMNQRVNAERLAAFQAEITVSARPAPEPIEESR